MNRIKELRKNKKMTQIRLSIELGVSQETVSAYEKGKYYPSFQSLLKMREIFGVGIDFIMGLDNDKPNTSEKQDDLFLKIFKDLCEADKKKAIAYIQGLNDSKK